MPLFYVHHEPAGVWGQSGGEGPLISNLMLALHAGWTL